MKTLPVSSVPAPATRREFLKQASTATVAAVATTALRSPVFAQAPSPGRVIGANDRLVVAVIGLGRGMGHITGHMGVNNVEIGYLCEADSNRLGVGQKSVAAKQGAMKQSVRAPQGVADFRRILDDKNVDAVSIAAPNFWHTTMAIMACQAGKHVYVEKPGSHNAFEAEAIVAAARKYNRVVQMGNQRRSYPVIMEAMARLKEGAIGPVRYARCWYIGGRGSMGRANPSTPPATLDYNLWQGPCPDRPYKSNVVHYNWHWLWHYGGGELANNGVHMLDLARWGLGVDYPKKVTFNGGRYHFTDDQETPDSGSVVFDFGHCGASWDVSSCNPRKGEPGPLVSFYGDKGSLLLKGNNDYRICDMNGKEIEQRGDGKAGDHPHFQNFADAIRKNTPLNSPIVEGQKSSMLCHLGNIAYRSGQMLNVDSQTGRLRDNPAGQKLWGREYRKGWGPNRAGLWT